jgi:hypothetical protein
MQHACVELMHEQQTTTHTHKHLKHTITQGTCTNALNSGLKVLGNTQMFCIIEFHFIGCLYEFLIQNLYYCSPKACNDFGNGV